jgi:hypothetical protein
MTAVPEVGGRKAMDIRLWVDVMQQQVHGMAMHVMSGSMDLVNSVANVLVLLRQVGRAPL